ncbi:hypothetical protein [Methanoregula sp.]|uniref:hypothetical protein n=1 Tax=Methanoregula sp. TaxID=2052170 RepID=UPI002BBD1885|nr:hypothetical protein [Methanoregula sp.]HVP95915.1 hypothetical protein [Methanoregula sp.]
MSKMVMVALWFLVGLFLLIGGIAGMGTLYVTGICLVIAGLLIIVLAIKKAMWKNAEMSAPAK